MGYGPWKLIKAAAKKVYDVGAVQKLVNNYGQQTIQSIVVGRTPINSTIKNILNLISLGKFDENQRKLGYDDVFHLFMIITLAGGHKFKFEKNHDVTVASPTLGEGAETRNVPINKGITLRDFVQNGTTDKSIFHYSRDSRNCQHFVSTLLRNSGLLNNDLSNFINQNAAKLVASLPITNTIGHAVTDLAQKLSIIIGGSIKRKC
jgi:hypothetical protein